MNKLGHAIMIILPTTMLLVLCLMISVEAWWAYSLYIFCAAGFGACIAFAIAGMMEEKSKSEAEEEDEIIELEEDEE